MDRKRMMLIACTSAALLAVGALCHADTIRFSGYTWDVRPSGRGGPGPNNWDQNNAWVDGNGYLHLRLTKRNNNWYCSEVSTQERLGFGSYQFWIIGRVDRLDKNVVFGLFLYPPADVGEDGSHEIDIEFARWGNPTAPIGNYTVWPVSANLSRETKTFLFALNGERSSHRFVWGPKSVLFSSQHGHYDNNQQQFMTWLYQPGNPSAHIAQKPMKLHINIWCHGGRPPSDGQEVEVIVRAFKFTPL